MQNSHGEPQLSSRSFCSFSSSWQLHLILSICLLALTGKKKKNCLSSFLSNFGISWLHLHGSFINTHMHTRTYSLCHFNFPTCSQFRLLCALCTVPSGQVYIKHSQLCQKRRNILQALLHLICNFI